MDILSKIKRNYWRKNLMMTAVLAAIIFGIYMAFTAGNFQHVYVPLGIYGLIILIILAIAYNREIKHFGTLAETAQSLGFDIDTSQGIRKYKSKILKYSPWANNIVRFGIFKRMRRGRQLSVYHSSLRSNGNKNNASKPCTIFEIENKTGISEVAIINKASFTYKVVNKMLNSGLMKALMGKHKIGITDLSQHYAVQSNQTNDPNELAQLVGKIKGEISVDALDNLFAQTHFTIEFFEGAIIVRYPKLLFKMQEWDDALRVVDQVFPT